MKGYPKSKFDLVDQSQIQSIEVDSISTPTPVFMQPFTSNKGPEDWELITSLDQFTKKYGPISFARHGQAQLTVAQALRSGAYVLGKRITDSGAYVGNFTLFANLYTPSGGKTYLYLTAESKNSAKTLEAACGDYIDQVNQLENVALETVSGGTVTASQAESASAEDTENVKIPLFTISATGTGDSLAFVRISPSYSNSSARNYADYMRYNVEVLENNEVIETVMCTLNPEIISNGTSQFIERKVRSASTQIKIKAYDRGIYTLAGYLAQASSLAPADIMNMDLLNGRDRTGKALKNIVSIMDDNSTEDNASEWKSKVADAGLEYTDCINAGGEIGIPLNGGSDGAFNGYPIMSPNLTTLLSNAFTIGESDDTAGNSIIYDVDAYKVDAIFDCNWPASVKKSIINVVEFRQDMVFLADMGTTGNRTLAAITEYNNSVLTSLPNSRYVAKYHNYCNIIDPFSKKEITVTMPYLLVDKMVKHINNGVGRPFAGIANDITFSNIIDGTVNFYPIDLPGVDQKQALVDLNVNYISMYDGVNVMETMYTNAENYSQLSYLHNIMSTQEIIKAIRTRCPRIRYTFLSNEDLETYIDDIQAVVKAYSSNFESITCEYQADERYEQNNIFYAVLNVKFKNFVQEECFKIIAIS